jgi:hypothetical protein
MDTLENAGGAVSKIQNCIRSSEQASHPQPRYCPFHCTFVSATGNPLHFGKQFSINNLYRQAFQQMDFKNLTGHKSCSLVVISQTTCHEGR